ncbi:hypothetical protein MPTK1_5g21690 [Marchantia polymorpha subsp. ruderalis]|nr:hypothetical protein MARPO_0106s0030 [Marchantia polymorpha]BBN12637.1 hypothetical protein Mp_5g21690 [Marchantia polymorpha subsp. ruderalis]|eukprot:PTQ31834.1 hypothetical protein MARPO_0106s0030 [Marchantia polymorpha]
MSGAQGANPPGSRTATAYSMAPGANTESTKDRVDSTKDASGVPIVSESDGVKDSAGLGGPVFGNRDDGTTEGDQKPDLAVTGSA